MPEVTRLAFLENVILHAPQYKFHLLSLICDIGRNLQDRYVLKLNKPMAVAENCIKNIKTSTL